MSASQKCLGFRKMGKLFFDMGGGIRPVIAPYF